MFIPSEVLGYLWCAPLDAWVHILWNGSLQIVLLPQVVQIFQLVGQLGGPKSKGNLKNV